MVVEISDYYKEKGFNRLYVATNTEGRRVATIRKPDKSMTSMSYAKYLYTSYYKCDVPREDHVDHINGDKTDDRIENLQVISGYYNRVKDINRRSFCVRTCPVCGSEFLYRDTKYYSSKTPCCSRRCSGIKSHWKHGCTSS